MPIRLPLQHSSDRPDAAGHQERPIRVDLDAVDYSNAADVSTAVAAISEMGELGSFVSWAFQGLSKEEAIAAISHTALCERAAMWQENNPGQTVVASLMDGNRQQARSRFLSLLTPKGLAAIMEQYSAGRYESLPHGVRFTPNTGSSAVDALLAEVLPHAEAAARLREWGDVGQSDGWHLLGAVSTEAVGMRAGAAKGPQTCDSRMMEVAAMAMSQSAQAVETRIGEARFWEEAAAYWEGANGPAQEAVAWGRAARAWQAVGQFERAAEAREQQAAAWEREAWRADGTPPVAAEAWEKAAEAWGSAGAAWRMDSQLSPATGALEMEAQAWLASGQFERAADVWAQAVAAYDEAGDEARSAAAQQHESAARAAVNDVRGRSAQ